MLKDYHLLGVCCLASKNHFIPLLPDKPQQQSKKIKVNRDLSSPFAKKEEMFNIFRGLVADGACAISTSWTIKMLSWIWRPPTKALCSSSISSGNHFFSLFVMVFDTIFYMKLQRLIGRYCSSFSGMPTLGIKVTFIHAPTNFQQRLALWDQIQSSIQTNQHPWICMGDFNEILYRWEKVGRRQMENYRMAAFQEFLNACELMDVESKGCLFTWSNNRDGDALVKERLDRAVCTLRWRVTFPDAIVFALPAIGSDHSPILLDLLPVNRRRKKAFKYEDFWAEDEEYNQIVSNSWHSTEDQVQGITTKLLKVAESLLAWSKKRFKNGGAQIVRLKKEIQEITNRQNLDGENYRLRELKKEVERLWRQEEVYWGMRSRIQWLNWGDRNTKYFHATVLQRRQRNKIAMLKNDREEWCREPYQLNKMVNQFFQDLYKKEGSRDIEPVIAQIPCIVNEEFNSALTAELTMEEVSQATFQLGALKAPGPDGLNGKFYKIHWDEIKEDVFQEVKNFFRTGTLNPDLNKT